VYVRRPIILEGIDSVENRILAKEAQHLDRPAHLSQGLDCDFVFYPKETVLSMIIIGGARHPPQKKILTGWLS